MMLNYRPIYGDRLATKAFCRCESNLLNVDGSKVKRKSLLDNIRSKMLIGGNSSSKNSQQNALKLDRRIDLGWLNYDESRGGYVQFREKSGGSTRKLTVKKNTDMNEILKSGQKLFFPLGLSKKGRMQDFAFEMRLFSTICK